MDNQVALWLGYGLIIGSWPIIVFNVCNLVLSAVILWLKLQEGSAERRQLVWWA